MSDRHRVDVQRAQSQHGAGQEERVNQSTERWAEDEPLGDKATKAAVLYANMEYPNLKTEYPNWIDRAKQIHRNWRNLGPERRAEYVQKARENRASRTRVPRKRNAATPSQSRSENGRPDPSSDRVNNESVEEQIPNRPLESNGNHPPQNLAHLNGTTMSNTNHQNIGIVSQLSNSQPGSSQVILHHYNQQQQQQMTPASMADRRTNGGVIVNELTSTSGQGPVSTRPVITPEIAQRHINLTEKQSELKKRHDVNILNVFSILNFIFRSLMS